MPRTRRPAHPPYLPSSQPTLTTQSTPAASLLHRRSSVSAASADPQSCLPGPRDRRPPHAPLQQILGGRRECLCRSSRRTGWWKHLARRLFAPNRCLRLICQSAQRRVGSRCETRGTGIHGSAGFVRKLATELVAPLVLGQAEGGVRKIERVVVTVESARSGEKCTPSKEGRKLGGVWRGIIREERIAIDAWHSGRSAWSISPDQCQLCVIWKGLQGVPLTAASTQLRAGLLPRRVDLVPLAGPTSSSSGNRVFACLMAGGASLAASAGIATAFRNFGNGSAFASAGK